MEFLCELVFELIFEGGLEVTSNRKISKWIRYPLLGIFILLFLALIFLVLFMGVSALSTSIIGGVFVILIGLFLFGASIYKFRQFYIREKSNLTDDLEK